MEKLTNSDHTERIASSLGFYDASQDHYEVTEREEQWWTLPEALALESLKKVVQNGSGASA